MGFPEDSAPGWRINASTFFAFLIVACSFAFFIYAIIPSRSGAADVATTIFISICGDGLVQPDELCDSGAGSNIGAYASSTGTRSCGPDCRSFGPYCGDGILQVRFTEECDDGNNTPGDLCSDICKAETALPPKSTGAPPVGSIPQVPGAIPGTIPSEILTKVVLRGKAYPNSTVNILLDGKTLGAARADSNADFLYTTTDITPGTATFSFSAKDAQGTDSLMSTVVFEVIQSAVTTVANVFLPPTINLSATKIDPGGLLTLSGQSVPTAQVTTEIHSDATSSLTATVNGAGNWALQVDTGSLALGSHTAKSFFKLDDSIKSGFGKSVSFTVGADASSSCGSADINGDNKVNLVDFSIFLLSWNTADARADFNCDKSVNLADFSIMLFNWTG